MYCATANRRLQALKRVFDFLALEQEQLSITLVKPCHSRQQGRALVKRLSAAYIKALFARIAHPRDRAVLLFMLRGGWRVSEVASLKVSAIHWAQQALLVEHGKGRKDRAV